MKKTRLLVLACTLLSADLAHAACGAGGGAPAPPPPSIAPPPVLTEPKAEVAKSQPEAEATSEEDEAPAPRRPINKRWALFGSGMGIAGAAYLGSAAAGIAMNNGYLGIPIAGSFVGAAMTSNRAAIALLSIDGALQLGGLAMVIVASARRR